MGDGIMLHVQEVHPYNGVCMSAIWPGDDRYNDVMEAAKVEYNTWVSRNKKDFVIAKKAEQVDDDEFDPYDPVTDGWGGDEGGDDEFYDTRSKDNNEYPYNN
jgi:hypothetical protein